MFDSSMRAGIFLVLLAMSATTALAQPESAPSVESFSPEGEVRSIQQIAVRFSHDMVKLGEADAKPPLTWSCEGESVRPVTTRWVDTRRWVAEFQGTLSAGTRCEARLREGLQSLAGIAIAQPDMRWSFTTGGPKVNWFYPAAGSRVKENQVFLLSSSAATERDALAQNVKCTTESGSRPVTVLSHDLARAAFAQGALERRFSEINFSQTHNFAVMCGERLPNDTPVRLIWGKDIATLKGVSSRDDQSVGNYTVRSPLRAHVRCTQLDGTLGCDPRQAIRVEFNEDLSLAQLRQVTIRDAAGASLSTEIMRSWPLPDTGRTVLTTRPAGAPEPLEGSVLTVTLPDRLSDLDGREISNRHEFPQRIQFATLPPYVGFPRNSVVLPFKTGVPALLPLAVRRVEKALPVTLMRMGGESLDSTAQGDALAVRAAASASAMALWQSTEKWPQSYESPLRAYPVTAQQQRNWVSMSTQHVPTQGGVMEFVPIDLVEPGLYLVEAHSSTFSEHMTSVSGASGVEQRGPRQRAAVVVVTNLNITTRMGDGGQSLVWVTALDSGLPVEGVAVDVLACDGKALAQGDTDLNGLLRLTLPSHHQVPSCAGRNWPIQNQTVVVARKGKDLALLVSQVGAHQYGSASRYSVGHTVLDRTLFKPGETVHMQHLVRKMIPTGFDTLPQGVGKVELRFERELVATLPLTWDASGQATSQWLVPSNAKLGQYSATVVGPDGSTHAAQLAVEEFRAPVFEAALGGKAHWAAGKQTLNVNLRLAYLAGGAAAGQKTELLGRYQQGVEPPVQGYAFADALLPYLQVIPMKPMGAQLDAKGTRLLTFSPPVWDRPFTLQAEMKFSDPNGEVQTVAQNFPIWHADTKLGVRVTTRPGSTSSGITTVVQALVLDARDRPLAGRTVALFVQAGRRDRMPDQETPICTVQTNTKGEAACELADLPPIPGPTRSAYDGSGWLFRIKGSDSVGKPVTSSVFKHAYEIQSRHSTELLTLNGGQPVAAGQPAQLTVRAPFLPATLLLTVERESVSHTAVHRLTQASTAFSVPVQSEWAPNVQVHARFVRGLSDVPEAVPANPLPLAAAHTLSVGIAPTHFALDVKVEPASTVAPTRSTVTVKVNAVQRRDGTVAAGARLTLIAVDEALLALKDNSSWKVLERVMRARGIQVHGSALEGLLTRSPVFGLQPSFWPVDDRGRSISAPPAPVAAPAAMMLRQNDGGPTTGQTLRSQFSTLAFWKTDVVLDAQGQASVVVPFNDSLTKWRLVAVVMHGADRFGTGEATVQTTQPVQIFSGLPPVVRSGDRLIQQVSLRNTGSAAVSLQVRARAAPKVEAGQAPMPTIAVDRTILLAPGQSRLVTWTIAVPEGIRALAWNISAVTPDGRVADAIELEQMTRPALPVTVRQATLLQLNGKVSLPVAMPANAQPGLGGVGVALQDSLVSASLSEVRRWMTDYPYACLEQTSSKIIVTGDVGAWDRLMLELPKYLDRQGLVRYFPESSLSGSEMLTAYLLDVAAARGWSIPAASRDRMLAGLHQVLLGKLPGQDWLPTGSNTVARMLSLQATLAEQGILKNMAQLPVRADDPGSLPTVALTDWVRALLAQPPATRSEADLRTAAALLRSRYDVQGTRLNWRNENHENWWWFMWSGDVAAARTALVLQQWQAVDPSWKSDVPLVIAGLVGRQKQGRWSTTVANAWATIALQRFAASVEKGPVSGNTQLSLAGEPKAAQTLVWPQPVEALLKLGTRAGDKLLMEHQGTGAPWATVSIKAAVRLDKPDNAGMRIEKSITAVEQKVKGQWSVGDVARVRLTMHSQADLTWVVVHDPVPSGATILGRGLGRESSLAQLGQTNEGPVWPSYVERAADSYRGYYRWVPRGTWSTEYSVRINNAGQFRFPATRVEAMYAPEIYAETPNADWIVRSDPSSVR